MPDTTNNDVAIARWKRGVSPPLGPRLGCRRISLGVHRRATCAIVLEARSRRQRSRELSLLTPIPVTNHKIWAEFDAIWVLAGSGQIFAGAGRNQIWTGSGSLRAGFDRIWVGLGSSWAKLGRSSASSGAGSTKLLWVQPHVGRVRPTMGQGLTKLGRARPSLDCVRPSLRPGSTRPGCDLNWAGFHRICLTDTAGGVPGPPKRGSPGISLWSGRSVSNRHRVSRAHRCLRVPSRPG